MSAAGSILLCMGTRPEIIKMAPVYEALRVRGLQPAILHTGQHEELAEPMYQFFGLEPSMRVDLSRQRSTLAHLSALVVDKVGEVLEAHRPQAVLVHGDTSSALMAALAAFYEKIQIGHVEAGLRSHDLYDPFPEEGNRVLLARLARWHFAPTAQAMRNLAAEGVPSGQVHMVGNTVVDAVALAAGIVAHKHQDIARLSEGQLAQLPAALDPGRKLILVTAHRRENIGEPLANIALAVGDVLRRHPEALVVWPLHANPAVRETVMTCLAGVAAEVKGRLFLTDALGYGAVIWLLRRAWLVLSDSGGIQEEAASLHIPILVMRMTTERPELIEGGGGLLIGTDRERLVRQVGAMFDDPTLSEKMSAAPNPFGDGYAASRIAAILARDLDQEAT